MATESIFGLTESAMTATQSPEEVRAARRAELEREEATIRNSYRPTGSALQQSHQRQRQRGDSDRRVEAQMSVPSAEERQANFYKSYNANMKNASAGEAWEKLTSQEREAESIRIASQTAYNSGMASQGQALHTKYNDIVLSNAREKLELEKLTAGTSSAVSKGIKDNLRTISSVDSTTGNKVEHDVNLKEDTISKPRITEYGKFTSIKMPGDGKEWGLMSPTGQVLEYSNKQEEIQKAVARYNSMNGQFAIVDQELETLERAIDYSKKWWNTGLPGQTLQGIGAMGVVNEATDLAGMIDYLESHIAFDRLQAMREASETGGALGQVSQMELVLLKSALGSLRQSQGSDELTRNLENIMEHYERFRAIVRSEHSANDINYMDEQYEEYRRVIGNKVYLINKDTGVPYKQIK